MAAVGGRLRPRPRRPRSQAPSPRQAPAPLWTREYRLFFVARSVSLLGDAMLQVALAAAVLRAGYGPSGVGYALAAWTAPVALFVLLGGVLSDRFRPRRMMVGADLARVVVQAVLAGAFLAGAPALWQVLGLQVAGGLATAMFLPGATSLVPQVAGDAQRANAALRVSEALTTMLGPALAGLLLALSGPALVFAIDAATYGVSALCLLALRLAPAVAVSADTVAAVQGPLWRDLAEGWQEFRARAWLWGVIAVWALLGLTVLGPTLPLGASVMVDRYGEAAFGAVMSAFGGGTVLGGLLGFRLKPSRPLAAGAAAMLAFALIPLVVATGPPLAVVAAGHVAGGAGFAFWGVMWATTLQTQVPAAVLNRVGAYDVAGSIMALPLGRALAGPAAAVAGAREVLLACTGLAVAACTCLLAVPAVRGLRRKESNQRPHDGEVDQGEISGIDGECGGS